jgi:SsrA-binding protein
VKLDIAIAKGKKLYDKREAAAKRDQERDARQALANRN